MSATLEPEVSDTSSIWDAQQSYDGR
jgi:hypothetical protein